MLKKKIKEVSLSEKLTSLINAKPNLTDDEDEDLTTVKQITVEENESDFSADELDVAELRKLNTQLLDADDSKYLGKKSSRSEVTHGFEGNPSNEEGSEAEETQEEQQFTDESDVKSEESAEDEENEDGEAQSNNESEAGGSDAGSVASEQSGENGVDQHVFVKTGNDIEKGKGIKNQINIWDLLLEGRIKFQKCLAASNQLPKHDNFKQFETHGGAEFQSLLLQNQKSLKKLLNSLMKLQHVTLNSKAHLKRFSDETNTSKYKSSDDDEIISGSDVDDNNKLEASEKHQKLKKLTDFANEIEKRHKEFEEFRNETIQKWNDKTRIGQISSKNFSAFEESTLKQIKHVMLDKNRLIKRTQIKRSSYHILGEADEDVPPVKKTKTNETDVNSDKKNETGTQKEIFDDDDFYHQLLSELLKRKAVDVTDPVQLGRQWIQLQKIRSKMKKKVDVKASKGRKVRYVVHPKLVNFMMPIDNFAVSDESRTELLNSLFGRNKK